MLCIELAPRRHKGRTEHPDYFPDIGKRLVPDHAQNQRVADSLDVNVLPGMDEAHLPWDAYGQ